MTVAAALRAAAARLPASPSPGLDAELLLAEALGVDRAGLLARAFDPLPRPALATFEALVARRAAGEPVAYLLGRAWFHGRRLAVGPAVLIPRPETELLVDWALERLAMATAVEAPRRVLDVGTGSGAIIVALAAGWRERAAAGGGGRPEPIWRATDASAEAVEVARFNAAAVAPDARIAIQVADLWPPGGGQHDLVMANLPYVGLSEAGGLPPDVMDFEPHGALFSGGDGLDLLRRFCAELPEHLAPGGAVALEVGWRQAEAVAALLGAALPAARVTARPDLAGHLRMVCAAPAR